MSNKIKNNMKETNLQENGTPELPGVVAAMLDALNDKSENVVQSVFLSVRDIAKLNPVVVIHSTMYYLELHPKIPTAHLALLLRVMEEICKDHGDSFNTDSANSIAQIATEELSGEANQEASDLLVALGKYHSSCAAASVLNKLEPGSTPHAPVVRTMGMLAGGNAFGVVPFIKLTMSVIVPMMGSTRDDQLKQAFSYTLGKFAEAINDYAVNIEKAPDSKLEKEMFSIEMLLAYEILVHTWLPASRDHETTEAIVTAIGPILTLLPPDPEGKRIVKLVPILLSMCKRVPLRLAATRVIATLLTSATEEDKAVLHPHIEHIHSTLSDLVCRNPFEASREAVLTHYEVLRCSHALVTLYEGEGLDRFLQQLKSPHAVQRSRALVVIRYLINTLRKEDAFELQKIASSLQESLNEGNQRQLVGAIAAVAARFMHLLTPEQRASFVRFMVMHCNSKNEGGESCEEALNLLATTVEGAEIWLWPLLLDAFIDPACASAVIPVMRALMPMALKIIEERDIGSLRVEFHSSVILGKCLELLNNQQNIIPVLNFLKCVAPLIGTEIKELWEPKLTKIINLVQNAEHHLDENNKNVQNLTEPWEEEMIELLEESMLLEPGSWSKDLSKDLVDRLVTKPRVAPFLAAVTTDVAHTSLLIYLTRTHTDNRHYAKAVGICARHDLQSVMKLMEEACVTEDSKKTPLKLLGLMKDLKAAATVEAAKAGLLRSYAEIARRADAVEIFSSLDTHVLNWIIRQLNDAREISTKEAGLLALEYVGGAAHPSVLPESTGYRARGPALASILALLQTASGHRPLSIYPAMLKAVISLIRIPPPLSSEEREVLLSTLIQKILGASSEINSVLSPCEIQQILDSLGVVCSEVVFDSADALAELSESLLPWMQTGSYFERKAAFLTLRSTLRSYHDSLKYTYPGGKLETGKLLGRILSRSADPEPVFRTLVVDCVVLALNISAKHRSLISESHSEHNLDHIKTVIVNEDINAVYEGVKLLATASSQKVAGGEAVGLAEGLILDLNSRGEGGLAAAISLAQHFEIRGSDLAHAAVHLTGEILSQLKHMENVSCKKGAIIAIKTLAAHHPQEVVDALLSQSLPLSKDTEACWKELGNNDEHGLQILDLLIQRLGSNKMLDENALSGCPEKNSVASFNSLSSVMALGHFFQTANSDGLIEKRLPELLFALLASMAAWLHANAPVVAAASKYGFVPNKEAYKINPHHEAYTVLIQVLNIVNPVATERMVNGPVFQSDCKAEENLMSTVCSVVRCISNKDTILTLARSICRLATSVLPAQRAVSAAFYAELVGRPGCGDVWLEAILDTLHEATADSSPLVRRLAIIGLTRVSYLQPVQIEEHIGNSINALLEELEVVTGSEGGNGVTLEALRGLAVLLAIKGQLLPNPRVVLSLKPFIEKENWEVRLAAINALGAIAQTWKSSNNTESQVISDHFLGCLPCLIIRIEDPNPAVAKAARETLHDSTIFLQSESLTSIIQMHLKPQNRLDTEIFFHALIDCMIRESPQRVEELRNAVGRGYSRSENAALRATSALILGFLKSSEPDDIQRLLQLLKDTESVVRTRAARALSMCFTL